MTDPPASMSNGEAFQPPIDPIAESPDSKDVVDYEIRVTSPSGSTEILPHYSSSNTNSTSDQENSWVPPKDLSALKFPRASTQEQSGSMPRSDRRVEASSPGGSSASTPLMNNENTTGSSTTSPTLQVPLPPETVGATPHKRASLGSSTSTGTPSSATSKSALLNRKAQRYSSLKKRKGPNTLLNRLFCNSTLNLGSNNSMVDDADGDAPPVCSTLSVHSGSSAEENTISLCSHKPMNGGTANSCLSQTTTLLEQATVNLTLNDEAKVRHSIQTSLEDSLKVGCSGPRSPSPPTFQVPRTSFRETSEDDTVASATQQPVKLIGDAAVGSTSSPTKSAAKSCKNVSILDEDNDIEEPNTEISMSIGDDDIAETASQPMMDTLFEKPELVPKVVSSDDLISPQKIKPNSKPMKTPGGLVIPSPFTYSGKGVFPISLDNFYATLSVQKSPPREKVYLKKLNANLAATSPLRTSTGEDKHCHLHSQLPIDIVTLSMTASSSSSTERKNLDRVEQQRDTSPPPMVRITSSLEDLATVQEASTSKENSERSKEESIYFDNLLPRDSEKLMFKNPPGKAESSDSLTEALTVAQKELQEELILEEEQFFVEIMSSSSSEQPSLPTTLPRFKDREVVFEEIKAKYERKINEQKDQAALANRVARMRLDEIERLEVQMDAMKERQFEEDEFLKLKDRLQQFQQEKKKEVDRVKKEMEARMKEQLKQAEANFDKSSELQRLEQELAVMKQKLADANLAASRELQHERDEKHTDSPANPEIQEIIEEPAVVKEQLAATRLEEKSAAARAADNEQCNLESQMSSPCLEAELIRVKRELAAVTEKLNCEDSVLSKTDLEAELKLVTGKLAEVNETLASKEKELADNKNIILSFQTEESPSRALSRFASPRSLPVRFVGKAKRQLGSDSKPTKQRDETFEIYEREKESLRQQISLLDQQATESSREHDRALAELREASEQEIVRIKKEMESRLELHLDKERELKQSLSEVTVQEKEELLKQIKLLQAEKKMERTGGLREVQKKEDLLQRISVLEKKEKNLIEDHERAIQDLRARGDMEIQRLRSQMQKQDEVRAVRERELEQAISETSSFEKEDLVRKMEKLEALLESERSGAVLVKIKISNLEKEANIAEQMHRDAIEALNSSRNAEINLLKNDIDKRLALEQDMQIITVERDELKEEVQHLKAKLVQESSHHAQKYEELLLQLADEAATFKTSTDKLEQTTKERVEAMNRKADQRCEDLQQKSSENIDTLAKKHEEEMHKVKCEVQEVEDKYKLILAESDAQFELFQKAAAANLEQLEKELQEKDAFFEEKLHVESQRTAVENKNLREQIEEFKIKQASHVSQMKDAEDNHNKQFEDILAQLDLVEAEHQHTMAGKEKALLEKEAIMVALGLQLTEAQRKITEAQHERTLESELVKEVQQKCQNLEEKNQHFKTENRELNDAHKKFFKEAAIAREKACEEAREEMIEKAETQFQQANEHYVKLRKQYDDSQERAKKLESELRLLKKKIDKTVKEKETCEIDLKAEVAKLHAANAKVESDAAHKAKEYRRELERLLQTAQDFEAKADEAEKTSRSIQTTLATVVAEKEKLRHEYEEMKSVSEELMAIVEGHERHEC